MSQGGHLNKWKVNAEHQLRGWWVILQMLIIAFASIHIMVRDAKAVRIYSD